MNIKEIISKKKRGQPLTADEIKYFVDGFTNGSVPDYQAAALLMAIYFKGMDSAEVSALTDAMVHSGEVLDLSAIPGVKVDKHSTGGVGDKISLVVMPVMAALGIPSAKMSGRGLGHTGGTIDKLESIPGFRTEMPSGEFFDNVRKYGIALVGQTGSLAPADKKIYALRDATECVDSVPLIASSIMSKKIASGADVIVLDVKVGSGSFMKTEAEARELAQTMAAIGGALGKKTVAVLTAMEQPLGREVGNACEVFEAIQILRGMGENDELEVAVKISACMAYYAGKYENLAEAEKAAADVIVNGKALAKFEEFVKIQGGDLEKFYYNYSLLGADEKMCRLSDKVSYVVAEKSGYVSELDAEKIGRAAMLLGAGRLKKDDKIDHFAGIRCLKKIGEYVNEGEAVFLMRSNVEYESAAELLRNSYRLSDLRVIPGAVILGVVEQQ